MMYISIQQMLYQYILIQLRPVDAFTLTDKAPIVQLVGLGIGQTGKPGQWKGYFTAIFHKYHHFVGYKSHVNGPLRFIDCQKAHISVYISLSPLPHQTPQKSNLIILILHHFLKYLLVYMVNVIGALITMPIALYCQMIHIAVKVHNLLLIHFQRLGNLCQFFKIKVSIAPLNIAIACLPAKAGRLRSCPDFWPRLPA